MVRRSTVLGGVLACAALAFGACRDPVPPASPIRAATGDGLRLGTPGISLASLILVIGGPERLAAVSPEVRRNAWLRRIAPELASIATPFSRTAGHQIEEILALRLDRVILWGADNPLSAPLGRAGIPTLGVDYATPAELAIAARRLGAVLGSDGERRAEDFIRYYEDKQAAVARALQGVPDGGRPRVYYASVGPFQTEGSGSLVDAWIAAAGGINVAAAAGLRRALTVGFEDIALWAPDIIVAQETSTVRDILAEPRWRDLPAVRSRRVLANPKGVNAWCTRAAETALQLVWAAAAFHPDRFPAPDLAREIYEFHARFYGYQLSPTEIDRMLAGLPPP